MKTLKNIWGVLVLIMMVWACSPTELENVDINNDTQFTERNVGDDGEDRGDDDTRNVGDDGEDRGDDDTRNVGDDGEDRGDDDTRDFNQNETMSLSLSKNSPTKANIIDK